MPALVKSSVGSFAGTSGELGTCVCPFDTKNSMNLRRIDATSICKGRPFVPERSQRIKTLDFSANAAFRPSAGPASTFEAAVRDKRRNVRLQLLPAVGHRGIAAIVDESTGDDPND